MDSITQLRRLFEHNAWADEAIMTSLRENPGHDAVRLEYSHILAVEAIWLDRILGKPQRTPIWPDVSIRQVEELYLSVRADYQRFMATLNADRLDEEVAYANSAGLSFSTPLVDILLHVALHGQYHRGKVNLLLRQSDSNPVPADYITFVRGVPAATTPVPPRRS